jgi:hypothetical protein
MNLYHDPLGTNHPCIKRFSVVLLFIMLLLQACSGGQGNAVFEIQSSLTAAAKTNTVSQITHTPIPPTQTIAPSYTPTFTPSPTPTETPTPEPTDTATPLPPVIFAVIGDYGTGNSNEADVARLVDSWEPDFIITLGDNNYPLGSQDSIDQAIGQYYHSYIFPYTGSYGEGAKQNRFFPTLGNHDILTDNGKPYFDYFTLPGNERYYDFIWEPLHFFTLDNLDTEPDGVSATSVQGQWLQKKLTQSTAAWNIVYMHYPPYSSGTHGSTEWARWPYKEWGADIVLSGHDHTYERLEESGLTYIVNGLGGAGIYEFINILEGSQVRYNASLGAMRVEATDKYLRLEFITTENVVVDTFEMNK